MKGSWSGLDTRLQRAVEAPARRLVEAVYGENGETVARRLLWTRATAYLAQSDGLEVIGEELTLVMISLSYFWIM